MNQFFLQVTLFINLLITNSPTPEGVNAEFPKFDIISHDTLQENQILYNGRVWRNLYTAVDEDQFLFTNEFLIGSVTMRGRTYPNVLIIYDIYRDEILIPYQPVGILQLNKEMVDSFSIFFLNTEYRFVRIYDSTDVTMNGYFNKVYNGKTRLIVKYSKKIEKFADGGKYDKFYQINRVYLAIDGTFLMITGKKSLFRIFSEEKKAIRNYINKNNILIKREDAGSYIPVLKFIDSLPR